MIDLHLKIQEKNFEFFMQLVNNFDFVEVKNNFDSNLTKEQKIELDKRYNEMKKGTSKTVNWDVVKKMLQ